MLRSSSSGGDGMQGWDLRSLRSSGDWFPSRLRSARNGPPPALQGSHPPTTSISFVLCAPLHQAPPTAPAISFPSPSTTLGPDHLTKKAATTTAMTTPTFRQKSPPSYLVTPIQHHPHNHYYHHRVPHPRSSHAIAHTRVGGGSGGAAYADADATFKLLQHTIH